jgi:hypothetical protein
MRKSEATRFRFQCIHPPGPNYNQYDGEGGIYLGPQPEPQNFSYNPKDVSSDTTRLANYFYCYPSYEDDIISDLFIVRNNRSIQPVLKENGMRCVSKRSRK